MCVRICAMSLIRGLSSSAIVLATILAGVTWSAPVGAQSAEEQRSSDRFELEEIIVTARKREESLQQTPLSVSAFSGNDLERRNLTSLDQITEISPNTIFVAGSIFSGSNSAASVYIRGIGQTDYIPTTEPGVGVYVDGVYYSQSFSNVIDLIDIEQVEVLRGPQGTLFGRNTIGGAINVTTKKPEAGTSGGVSVATGRFNRIDGIVKLNVPISDTLFFKIAGSATNRDGFVERPNLSGNTGDDNTDAVRAALRWEPNSNWSVDLVADYSRSRENPAPGILLETRAENLFPSINPFTGMPDMIPPFMILVHNVFVAPGLVPELGAAAFFDDNYIPDGLISEETYNAPSNIDTWGLNGIVEASVGEVTVKSITSYRSLEALAGWDFDNTPLVISEATGKFDMDQFSQEFQILGKGFDDRLDWIFGLYHFEEEGVHLSQLEFSLIHFLSGAEIDNKSSAIFGQLNFDLTSKLSLTLGGRYTAERKRNIIGDECFDLLLGAVTLMDGSQVACAKMHSVIDPKFTEPLIPYPFFPLQSGDLIIPRGVVEQDIDVFTPHVNLSYKWSDDIMTYLSYSEGFKSGGFLQRIIPPQPGPVDPDAPPPPPGSPPAPYLPLPYSHEVPPSFEPEFAKVIEFGFKSTLAGGRVRLNGAIFRTDYEDLQITIFENLAPTTKNAAQASITGFELEATVLLPKDFMFTGGIGYLDAQYDKIEPIDNGEPAITLDSRFVNAPNWQLSGALSHYYNFGNGASLDTRLDWAYRSATENDSVNTPELHQPGLHLFNASTSYTMADDDWTLSFMVRNLTNKRYLVSGFDDPNDFGTVRGIVGRPREWGIKLDYRF